MAHGTVEQSPCSHSSNGHAHGHGHGSSHGHSHGHGVHESLLGKGRHLLRKILAPSHGSSRSHHGGHRVLTLVPLVALIFFEVSGGPYGIEGAVRYGGPKLAILGFLICPFIWSIPEALITTEMATTFPEDSGFVAWVSAAFGPFWGFQEGWWSWLSGVADNSLYPVLFLSYLIDSFPEIFGGPLRVPSLLLMTAALTYINWRGLSIVGNTAIALTVVSLSPFLFILVLGAPHVVISRWGLSQPIDWDAVDWQGYLNILFWNLNYWDSASTLAGEVADPSKSFPRACFCAVVLIVSMYVLPLMVGIGVTKDQSKWDDGYFAEVAKVVGGSWLRNWLIVGAATSNIGQFCAEMSSDAYQLLGMAERGMLPAFFAKRSKYDTPTLAILLSCSGVVLVAASSSFEGIIEYLNFLYALAALLEFAAFVWLRWTRPELPRPYKIPLGSVGAALLVVPASFLLIVVMCLASWQTYIFCGIGITSGLILYPTLVLARERKWMEFITPHHPPYEPTSPATTDAEDSESDDDTESVDQEAGPEQAVPDGAPGYVPPPPVAG